MEDKSIAIERLVENARQLHTLPAVAMEVLELTNNPVVDAQALKNCIQRDPALTSKLLRVVNSSLFGLSREVSDLNQALALLGTKPLKLLVLGFSLPSGLFGNVDERILEGYWRHSLTKAVAAREISQTIWQRPGDDVFIAGLLQDIGEMLLIEQVGRPYISLLQKAFCGGVELRRLEVEAMGFDHTELTSRLLEHWNLPQALVNAVRWHIDRRQLERLSPLEKAERRILRLAELVARLLADGDTRVLGQLVESGRDEHNLSKHRLDMLVADLEEKVDNLAEVLSLRLGGVAGDSASGDKCSSNREANMADPIGYRALLERAHAQLSSAAAEAAEDLTAARLGIDSEDAAGPSADAMALADQLRSLGSAVNDIVHRNANAPAPPQSTACSTQSLNTAAATSPLPVATITTSSAETVQTLRRQDTLAAAVADPQLGSRLAAAVAFCRQTRCPLSLLMVELGDVEELVFSQGTDGYLKARRLLQTACSELDTGGGDCLPLGEAAFVLVLPDCDRREVAAPAHEIIETVGNFAGSCDFSRHHRSGHAPVLCVGVGAATVAMPPKNFPTRSLIEAAARCLYGSLASGGGVLKSIEIYY